MPPRPAPSPTPDYYDRLAVAQALGQLDDAQAAFTREALRADPGGVEAWLAGQGDRLARVRSTLEEIVGDQTCTVSRLLVAAGQLNDLADGRAGRSFSISQEGPSSGSCQIRRQRKPARS